MVSPGPTGSLYLRFLVFLRGSSCCKGSEESGGHTHFESGLDESHPALCKMFQVKGFPTFINFSQKPGNMCRKGDAASRNVCFLIMLKCCQQISFLYSCIDSQFYWLTEYCANRVISGHGQKALAVSSH